HVHSPHDIFFNATGTRAYTASVTHSDILDTTDPTNPRLIASIHDPAINIHHDTQVTPDGKTLIIGDELAGAATGPQCPGGGLHFYDITNEAQPRKIGVFFADTQDRANLCTAHVFRINPDGKSLVIGWYNGGTRIVDISDPNGLGPHEIAHMVPTGLGGNSGVANSWASKAYKGYVYSNDRARGLDIMQLDAPEPSPGSAQGVVALIDTGINPYHRQFRWDDPRAYQHPSTYIPGYPENAVALPITLDEPNYWAAVRRDCASIWSKVEPGKLYWFPGTKIVGGISFGNVAGMTNCSAAEPGGGRILDTGGHGTMVASRAAGNTYGACRTCLVVAIQNPLAVNLGNPSSSTQEVMDSIRFAGNNAHWIDAQSNSWGPIVFPAWEPTGAAGLITANPQLVRAVEEVSQKHPAFWASGNGAAGRGGVIGSPTLLTPTLTPSAISVGGNDAGYVNVWPGFPPHVISDSCQAWAAQHRSTTGENGSVAGGTSGATPFAAGGAVRILLEARRILGEERTGVRNGVAAEGPAGLVDGPLADGKLTMAEWREVLFKTASSRHIREFEDGNVCATAAQFNTYPVKYGQIPKQAPAWLIVGYGAIDGPSRRLAYSVLNGERAMPVRTQEDAYFTVDDAARRATHEVYSRP
ncbi:MAG TPA: S8 family serine peptidase, partial [Actinomycetota bacterium]|nr:S8 family serine peptidase [Actinomycetota bacterium]